MTTGYIIRVVRFENGAPCPISGQFLESFDHEADGGRGFGTFTRRISRAMVFDTIKEAMAFRDRQSTVMPLRPDGEPNRPLSCTTINIEPLP